MNSIPQRRGNTDSIFVNGHPSNPNSVNRNPPHVVPNTGHSCFPSGFVTRVPTTAVRILLGIISRVRSGQFRRDSDTGTEDSDSDTGTEDSNSDIREPDVTEGVLTSREVEILLNSPEVPVSSTSPMADVVSTSSMVGEENKGLPVATLISENKNHVNGPIRHVVG